MFAEQNGVLVDVIFCMLLCCLPQRQPWWLSQTLIKEGREAHPPGMVTLVIDVVCTINADV